MTERTQPDSDPGTVDRTEEARAALQEREAVRALSPTYTRPVLKPAQRVVGARVVHRDTDPAKQGYAFQGETGAGKPTILRPPGTDSNVPPELVGVLIPYGPDTDEGYLVWVDPAEMALDTRG